MMELLRCSVFIDIGGGTTYTHLHTHARTHKHNAQFEAAAEAVLAAASMPRARLPGVKIGEGLLVKHLQRLAFPPGASELCASAMHSLHTAPKVLSFCRKARGKLGSVKEAKGSQVRSLGG